MKKLSLFAVLVFFSVICSTAVLSDVNLVNSRDWRDVYSIMLYGGLIERSSHFVNSRENSELVIKSFSTAEPIHLFNSRSNPYIVGYGNVLKSKGYTVEEDIVQDNVNMLLADRLTDINKFIILDDSYGYNAISVVNYAILDNYYVLFTDRTNIRDVSDFLSQRGAEDIIIYGTVDREVRTALEEYDPEIINYDGDRFLNNIEITKKYREISAKKQVVFTNGDFIEAGLVTGKEAVLFIGRQSVPRVTVDYIKESDISTAILIGNDLIITATELKRQLGVNVFVKFARSSRGGDAISQIEALDMFYLPRYILNLTVTDVNYNKAAKQLEVNLRNNVDVAIYFSGTYTIVGGETLQTVGDTEPKFIEANDIKTMVYDLEEPLGGENMTVDAYVIYGESKNALDRVFEGTFLLNFIDIADDSAIDIYDALYDKRKNQFLVYVKNTGGVLTYIDAEIRDLLINDVNGNYGTDEIINLKPGAKGVLKIPVEMDDDDIEENPTIKVRAYYGERSDALIKVIEREFPLKLKQADYLAYGLLTVIIILLILLIIKRKKKKKKHVI